MSNKPWTEEEDDYLRLHFPDTNTSDLAAYLGRSYCSVASRATGRLNLRKTKEFIRTASARKLEWTAVQEAYIRKHFPTTASRLVANALGLNLSTVMLIAERIGVNKDPEYLHAQRKNQLLKAGGGSRFKKGHPSANKGKPMPPHVLEKLRPTQFKKGDEAFNALPVGSIHLMSNGYYYKKMYSDPQPTPWPRGAYGKGMWRAMHYLSWEEVNGPVPDEKILMFVDGNTANYAVENLRLIGKDDIPSVAHNRKYGGAIVLASIALNKLKRILKNENDK